MLSTCQPNVMCRCVSPPTRKTEADAHKTRDTSSNCEPLVFSSLLSVVENKSQFISLNS